MQLVLTLAYDGSRFDGFQMQQPDDNTIVGQLHAALRAIGIDAIPIGSGRTDKGVHATGQVLHVALPEYWHDYAKLRHELDKKLPAGIKIRRISTASETFHARFDALRRHYRYLIATSAPNPFYEPHLTYLPRFDLAKVQHAIKLFEGTHAFGGFKKVGSEEKSDIRTLYSAQAYQHKGLYVLSFCGNAFLRSQIRMMVAALIRISEGKLTEGQLRAQLAGEAIYTRRLAPANGLYLVRVHYPPHLFSRVECYAQPDYSTI